MNVFLCLLAFAFSAIEEGIASRRTQAVVRKDAVKSGNWSALFDFVLFLDIYLILEGGIWLVVPICMGSWLGSWWSVKTTPKEVDMHDPDVRTHLCPVCKSIFQSDGKVLSTRYNDRTQIPLNLGETKIPQDLAEKARELHPEVNQEED